MVQNDDPATSHANLTDDVLVPFRIVRAGQLGRFVRLGSVVDTILSRHDYPDAVSQALAEAVVLTALLGAALKGEGRFTLQTRGDGAIRFLVVNYDTPSKLRGYASFDAERVKQASVDGAESSERMLGDGHLAFTIDPGAGRERYQGIVPLAGETLADAVHTYFRQSEQLPTYVRVSVGRERTPALPGDTVKAGWRWRASGLLVQHVPKLGGVPPSPAGDDDTIFGEDDDDWQRVRILAATAEDHELLDPMLTPHRLLYRLFHEDGVIAEPDVAMSSECSCSRDRVGAFIESFKPSELDDMREPDGRIRIRCEFCAVDYWF